MDKNSAQKSSLHSLLIFISMLALMVGFLTYLYLQNKELEKLANYQPANSPLTSVTAQPSAPSGLFPGEASVVVTSDGFIPATLLVKKGSLVTFLNQDRKNHQIYSDPHPSHNKYPLLNFDEPLTKDSSLTVIFDKTGTYTFHNESNPSKIRGTIVVE